jgi:TolB protein
MKRFLLALIFCALSPASYAQLKVDITRGISQPMPVAIPNMGGDARLGADIAGVVTANLERSGLFKPIAADAFIEGTVADSAIPRFVDWRQISAQALITGSVTQNGDKIRVAFRLWDVYGEQQIAGKEYNTFRSNWRRIAHVMSDEIYKRLTGESGYFDSRVVYVSESGSAKKRVKRLAIMDQDGENHKYLTDGQYLALTPRFSPNSQEVIYMSYAGRSPRVFLRDLQTGREESLGTFEGMSFAPRFTSDGNGILMSIAKDGVTNIYTMDLHSRKLRKLTSGGSIDTSPSPSPDGKRIVFNSDRGGSQQLYVMNTDGSGVQRISFSDGRYGTPVWSPRGDWIAFTKMASGKFFIGVMKPDGSGERLLTESFLDEGPTWSPNGRVIIFNRQTASRGGKEGTSKLYSVDVTGHNLREVVTPMDASDPAWSPLLPMQ